MDCEPQAVSNLPQFGADLPAAGVCGNPPARAGLESGRLASASFVLSDLGMVRRDILGGLRPACVNRGAWLQPPTVRVRLLGNCFGEAGLYQSSILTIFIGSHIQIGAVVSF